MVILILFGLEHNFLKKFFQISLAYSMVSVDSVDSVDTVKKPLTRFAFLMSYRDDEEFDKSLTVIIIQKEVWIR